MPIEHVKIAFRLYLMIILSYNLIPLISQLLFGKSPYTANNIHQLIANIMKRPLKYPKQIKISPIVEDVLRRTLTVNPEDRISWEELFQHESHFSRFEFDKLVKFALKGINFLQM